MANKPCSRKKCSYYPFVDFPTYLEIKIYLGEICRTYPHLAEIEIIGITTQMAEIYMIKLQKDACSSKSKARDIVFVDATIHAREWLSTSTAMYLINYIILNHHILDHINYYIVPCVNVDGYIFSMENKCYRLWRKNRTLNCSSDVTLQGVDLNRNFPIGFSLPGSSDDPGSFNYRGEEPLSEPASKAMSFAINKYCKKIILYISLHCYGNAILYPWSFTKAPIPDCQDLFECAMHGRNAICKHSEGKRKMRVGNAAKIMNLAAGTSTDYARYVHGIKFSYIFELQGYGTSGFTPHKKHIPSIGFETTMAIFAMARHAQVYYQRRRCKKVTADIIIDENDGEDENDDCKPCPKKKKKTCSSCPPPSKEAVE
ncbi:carboxypeptidase B-like [Atheta coriaria]|uniref:carboxypeptidase B-like n=1 Tax=Dalotia coriaria TaxID=877792 RepID=UPI0031F361B8